MATLEQVEQVTAGRPAALPWGIRERMVLLGIVLILAALGPAVYLLQTRPVAPSSELNPELIRRKSETLKPLEIWLIWQKLRDAGPDPSRLDDPQALRDAALRFRLSMAVVLLVAGAGVALTVVALSKKDWTPTDEPEP